MGRMFIQASIGFDVKIAVLDPSHEAPCRFLANEFHVGDFSNYDDVIAFGADCDVLTIEIEHVNADALEELEKRGVLVYPTSSFLRMVQDKGLQKEFYRDHQIPTAPFSLAENRDEVRRNTSDFPFFQKLRKGGYDGKGVKAIRNADELDLAFDEPSVLEHMIDFEKEISVIIARNSSGETKSFPIVEMEFNQEANLVAFLFSPANVSSATEEQAFSLAKKIVDATSFVGLLAVEMFVDKNGQVMVNEMAPRPHNSGHHTIEACSTSQYEQHLRAILNLPLGDTSLLHPAVMVNLLGEKGFSGPVQYENIEEILGWPGVNVHLYGKSETKPFRKMGHVTVTAETLEMAKDIANMVLNTVRVRTRA